MSAQIHTSRGATPSKLLQNARAKYELGDFQAARLAVDNALASGEETLPLLDLRAATYVKLGELKRAYKDATLMIKANKADSRGYLRCGQVERLQDNYTAAVNWYSHGLKKVPEDDPNHQTLFLQHEQAVTKMNLAITSSKPADPFAVLPTDIVHLILASFDHQQIVAILRVSRQWTTCVLVLCPNPQSFDFLAAKRSVTDIGLSACLRRLPIPPRIVRAANLTDRAAKALRRRLTRWENLQHFEAYTQSITFVRLPWKRFNDLRVVSFGPLHEVFGGSIHIILRDCHELRSATFEAISKRGQRPDLTNHFAAQPFGPRPNLKVLVLHHVARANCIPHKILEQFPNLEEFSCRNASLLPPGGIDLAFLRRLRTLSLSNGHNRVGTLRLPTSLEILKWTGSDIFWAARRHIVEAAEDAKTAPLDSLRMVSFAHSELATLPWQILGSVWMRITHLDLYQCTLPWNSFLELAMSGKLMKLRHLRISYQCLTDASAPMFCIYTPCLEELDLSDSSITGVMIKGLLTAPGSRLRRMSLINCQSVSADAIDWARKRGVVVSVRSGEEQHVSGSGRRLGTFA